MDLQKEREAFEAWFESRYDAHFMQFALDLDMYVDKHTQTCWEAWQAARAQANKQFENFIDQAIEDSACADERRSLQTLLEDFQDNFKSQAIPDGFVLVPKEPTPKMIDAADNCAIDGKVTANIVYKAMIEAQEQAND